MKVQAPPENWYDPGQSAHFFVATTVRDMQGVAQLTDTPSISLVLKSPDGSKIIDSAPVRDSLGKYHSDQVIPVGARPGIWRAYWISTGNQPAQNMHGKKDFGVNEDN